MSKKRSQQYIPQDAQALREEKAKLGSIKNQEVFAKLLTDEMQRFGDSYIDQPRLSRILAGQEATTILELWAFAKTFQIPIHKLIKKELQPSFQSDETFTIRMLQNGVESDNYLTELESDGRVLAFSNFPSFLFHSEQLSKRKEQFNLPSFENREYYTLDAYINFLFSVSTRFSLTERYNILTRYIDYFDRSKKGNLQKKHIVFFSRHIYPTLSRFANMEFFPKKGLIIILAPILQENDGDIFLEIRDSELCTSVNEFYHEKIEPFSNPMNLLRVGKRVIQQRLNGMSFEESICWFYRECLLSMPDSHDPNTILENFTPEIRQLLEEKTSK